jgi:hypothetical protein
VTSSPSTALITPSHAADVDRCRLLCDSIDQLVIDEPDHYILVDDDDYPLFAPLAGPRRHIVNEHDILPAWLKSTRLGVSSKARKVWFSTRAWPMRGWHVQQLRRIAIAFHIPHDGLLYCDSDMLFIKPFCSKTLWQNNALRLYRKDNGIDADLPDGGKLHRQWTEHAMQLNGLAKPQFPAHDYINNMVSWRRDQVIAMCEHIETTSGRHWLAAIGSQRSFSECQIYGAFIDGVKGGDGHWKGQGALCQTYWSGKALTEQSLHGFVASMDPAQVAIGIQSFTGTNPDVLRELIAA